MLIDLKQIIHRYDLDIKGVIQVGAHWAEEHDIYSDLGVKKILYFEPCTDAFNVICNKDFIKYKDGAFSYTTSDKVHVVITQGTNDLANDTWVLKCGCADKLCKVTMYVSKVNQGQSNSILEPKLHLKQHPEVTFTDTEEIILIPLDDIIKVTKNYNVLVMDVQGAEGLVLKGAEETLKHIDLIYTEINTGQTYEGNMELPEMDDFLAERGFVRVETFMPSPNWTWGDAAFIRRSLLKDFEQISNDLTSI